MEKVLSPELSSPGTVLGIARQQKPHRANLSRHIRTSARPRSPLDCQSSIPAERCRLPGVPGTC